MEPAKHNLSINLLSQDAFSSSMLGKVLLWALSVGRYIVVFTELIVILSFLSRFKLDRDLTDLNSEIAKHKAVIESYGDLETNVRQLQGQLEIIRQKRDQPSPLEFLNTLETIIPGSVRIQQLNITGTNFRATVLAQTSQGLNQFVTALSTQPKVHSVALGSIESSDDGSGLVVQVSAEVGEKTVEKPSPKPSSGKSQKGQEQPEL